MILINSKDQSIHSEKGFIFSFLLKLRPQYKSKKISIKNQNFDRIQPSLN